jgi:hypothetical protein
LIISVADFLASTMCSFFVIHFAAPKQIIQAADAIPATAIPLDDQPMSALLVGAAVILGQEIDQQPSDCGGPP